MKRIDKMIKMETNTKFISKFFLSEFIYGGIDGIITTFSIVAGSAGGNLSNIVIIVLGISNVISDGFSMAVSRYFSSKAEIEQGILSNKEPLESAFATFLSFVLIGIIPILPFIIYKNRDVDIKISLFLSLIIFFIIGYMKGHVLELEENEKIKSGFRVLFTGLIASLLAYYIGKYISKKYKR